MQHKTVTPETLIDWGAAWRALPGQAVCGDLLLVKSISDGVLLGVPDRAHDNQRLPAVAVKVILAASPTFGGHSGFSHAVRP